MNGREWDLQILVSAGFPLGYEPISSLKGPISFFSFYIQYVFKSFMQAATGFTRAFTRFVQV